jgi:hypothetical protein
VVTNVSKKGNASNFRVEQNGITTDTTLPRKPPTGLHGSYNPENTIIIFAANLVKNIFSTFGANFAAKR